MVVALAWAVAISACQGDVSAQTKLENTAAVSEPSTEIRDTATHTVQEIPSLFSDSDTQILSDQPNDPTIVRVRYVDVKLDLLDESEAGDVILLNLFEDAVFPATLEKKQPTQGSGYSWIGHLNGIEHSQMILVEGGDQIAGNITLPGGFYEVRYAGNDVHAIYEIDQSAFPPGDEPVLPDE